MMVTIQANTEVISNISYHDVKGIREDQEKKRHLEGGGENVKSPDEDNEEEFRRPEAVPDQRQHQQQQHQYHLVLFALAVPPKHGHGAIRRGNLTPGGKHERHHKQVGGAKKSLFWGLSETGVIFQMHLKNHR